MSVDLLQPGDIAKVTFTLQYAWFDEESEEHVLFDVADDSVEFRMDDELAGSVRVEMVKTAKPAPKPSRSAMQVGDSIPGTALSDYSWKPGTIIGYQFEDPDAEETLARFVLMPEGDWVSLVSGNDYEAHDFRRFPITFHYLPE